MSLFSSILISIQIVFSYLLQGKHVMDDGTTCDIS